MLNITASGAILDRLTEAQQDAIHMLESIIAQATREIENLRQPDSIVTTDWIEQDAARYHDYLVAARALSVAYRIAVSAEKESRS